MPERLSPRRVLAIDPGRAKCGLAVVDAMDGLLERAVIPREELVRTTHDWCGRHQPDLILLGRGTGSGALREVRRDPPVPVRPFPERDPTRRPRGRFLAEHPPAGRRAPRP